MTAVRIAVLVIHFIGLAAIIGPWLDRVKSAAKDISKTMVWGARVQVVTGIILVGLLYANDIEPDNTKISVKFLLALAIAAIAEIASRRPEKLSWGYWAVGGLTILNVIVAVAW